MDEVKVSSGYFGEGGNLPISLTTMPGTGDSNNTGGEEEDSAGVSGKRIQSPGSTQDGGGGGV